MAKELPFFKFHANEWLTGDIVFESYDVQGLFINVCATYWSKDCSITLAKLKQRLSKAKANEWKYLIDEGYIKVIDGQVFISFLDEQLDELSEQRQKRVEAGRKGGLSKAKAMLKHKDIEVDKEKDIEVDKEKKVPSLQEVEDFFEENGYTKDSAKKMFEYYEASRGERGRVWKDGRGNTVNNWKQKAHSVWFKKENKKGSEEYDFKNFDNVKYP